MDLQQRTLFLRQKNILEIGAAVGAAGYSFCTTVAPNVPNEGLKNLAQNRL